MANEFKVKNGLIVIGDLTTSGTITINGALAATQSWVTSQSYLTSASLSGYATQSYVTSAISALIDAAPAALDTLNELAAALGDDASFSTTVTNSIAGKVAKSGDTMTGSLTFASTADNVRLQKNSSFLNLRDPWNNIHLYNAGDGNYIDSNIHYWRSQSASYWMTLNNGNLGVGTVSPVSRLDVDGIISSRGIFIAQNSGTYNIIYNASNSVAMYLGGSGDQNSYYDNNSHFFRNAGGGTTFGRWNSTGLGIGTTSPSAKLHLYESTAADVVLRLTPSDGGYDPLIQLTGQGNNITQEGFEVWYDNDIGDVHLSTTYVDNAASIHFHTRTGASKSTSNERLTILGGGNVGVGISTPSEKLHVSGAAIFDGGAGNSSTDSVVYITKSTNDDWGLYVNNAGLDYGMYTRTSPSANYAFAIHNGTTWTTRITGNAIIYLGEKDAIRGNSDSWLRLNNSNDYTSGVYTPGIMRADGGFNVSGNTVWHAGNDGSGSGLDADTVDGIDSGSFLRSDVSDSFSGTLTMATQRAFIPSNYGHGLYGIYSAERYQHVWSMGAGYDLPADGVSNGNGGSLYGLAWSYNPDYSYVGSNAQSKPGLNHQLLLMMNGITHTALGSGIWTSGTITTTSHGNSSQWNTAYGWGNHASQSYATTSYVTTQINNLINGAPGALDTLDELAAALGDDSNFATTVTNSIAGKMPYYHGAIGGDPGTAINGVTRIYPSVNGPSGGAHFTVFTAMQDNNFYGWQFTALGNDAYFRSKDTVYGGWNRLWSNSDFTSTSISNWNTAYGWGDHSSVGYALNSSLANYLPLSGGVIGGAVTINGNLTVNGTITENSSIKLKENIETSEGNLEKVVNLRPVTYNKIGSQTTELGLIAEEVAEVYPEFVQYDENREPVGVHYSRLTAALIGAVKELTNQVQELNKKING